QAQGPRRAQSGEWQGDPHRGEDRSGVRRRAGFPRGRGQELGFDPARSALFCGPLPSAWPLGRMLEARSMPMDQPLILSLDSHGVPHRWISWQQACFYYAKNLVAWTLGEQTFTYYGGISRITGSRSSIT